MKYDDPINYTLNFKKILNFYVFNCVVPEVTQRDYSLEKYGWNDTKKLERELKKVSYIESGNWKSCQTVDEVQNYINDNNIVSFSCIFYNSKNNNVLSLLYCIRNSLAHGSFKTEIIKNRKIYYFENHKKGKLRGRFILYEKTLLDWIKIITEGSNDN